MIKETLKIVALLIVIYYLFLFEMSFLPFFTFFSFSILLIFLINIFENPKGRMGLFSAFFLGLMMDLYSAHYIGLMALGFLILSLLLKLILSRYVRTESIGWLPKI
jgi:rod shape-determining protein MreD